jgi:hypothetical protein
VDVEPSRLTTYALRSAGETVRFTVALVPQASGGATKVDRIESAKTEGGRALAISGHGWRDDLVLAPFGKSRAWTSGSLSADARLIVARTGGNGVERLLVVGARHVALPGIEMNFVTPTTAEFSRGAGHTWTCDFSSAPSGR